MKIFLRFLQSPSLDVYILDLQDYLTTKCASFADLEPDARLASADYIDRFHIQPAARGTYTQMLPRR
ncbi:MAG: hypothetical protein HY867_15465 [Chloroflexi bacterium]|nr:hypothetical protein [Chloroflexota bacterium]